MFRTVPVSIIRSFSLYTQQWYMSYRFADSLRAGTGWNAVPFWSIIRSFSLYTQQWYMSYRFVDSLRTGSGWNAVSSWSCSQAVSIPVWHIPLLCIQWKTHDDGQRNCPKHAEFHSKIKFEELVHLVGFIIRNLTRCTVTWTSNCLRSRFCFWSRRIQLSFHARAFHNLNCINYLNILFIYYYDPFPPTHFKCRRLRLHLTTLNEEHIHSVVLLWTKDRPVAETPTCTTYNIHKRWTSTPRAGFEPAITVSERLQSHALDRAATGIGLDSSIL